MTTDNIHITVAILEERLGGIEKHLARQTDALEKLANNAVQIALLQQETEHLKSTVDAVHNRLETHLTSHRQTLTGVMFEVLKVALAILGGALMAKYGLQ